ncbi:MAG: SsrA-binding protein SmpB [Clostridia bacterium]|jgi:SsrA-binding protein|nr:SsrA-binding protein SmpB [Clostridia bacterium]
MKLITENRQARHEYFIEETYQTGIVLEGSEVKSIRQGSVNLKDSFCLIANGEVFVKNMHIAVYDKSGAYNTRDSKRDRKLLLHKSEINRLIGKIGEKGYALIPLEVYFEGSLCKVKIGLCKGKHVFDKKVTLKERDIKRSMEREIKNY